MDGSFLGFAESQRDLALFLQLVACFICAFETLVLFREDGRERRWRSSFSFYVLQGLAIIWLLAGLVVTLPADRFIAVILQSLSLCPLFAYGAPPRADQRRVNRMRLLAVPLLALTTAVGLALGSHAWSLAASLVLGIPGIVFTITFLLSDEGIQKGRRPFLFAYVIFFGLFGLLSVCGAAVAVIMPTTPSTAATPVIAASFFVLALTLSLHAWRSFRRLNRGYGRPLTRMAIVAAFLSLPVVILVGLLLTITMGGRARNSLYSEYSTEADSVGAAIEGPIGEIDREVSILADMSGVAAFLATPGEATRAAALENLTDFSRQVQGSCVILDAHGRIAVSAGEGFSETDFAHSAWFTDALAGSHGRLLAPDRVTDIPTYYSTMPVWDLERGIVGVAMIARRVNAFFPALAPDRAAMVIDELGTILYASTPHLVHHALWPAGAVVEIAVDASVGHSPNTVSSVFPARYAPGTLVPWENDRLLLARSFLSIPGASLVYLGPILQAQIIRVGVLLATLVVLLIVLSFTAAGQVSLLDQARVERSESQYRALVENSPDWVSIVDSNGVFLFTNISGRLHLGIGDVATTGIPVESLLGKEHVDEIAACVRRTAAEGSVALETLLPSASGDVKVWQITFVPLRGSAPTHAAMLIAVDITDVRKAEARLIRAERMEALGTLAAGVAHQFNNINQISLWSLHILESDPSMPTSARASLGSLRRALDRSVEITTRMLPLSIRPAEDGWPCVGEMIRDRITSLHAEIERGGVEVVLDLRDSLPVGVGRGQLEFVVNALMSNALDALVERSIRRLSVETATVDSMTFVRVTDTGIGIAAEKLSSLFTPFYSEKGENAASNSPQARLHGVGLSLSVSHSIVGAAGGRIDAESTLGVGSTFTLWLPNASVRPPTDS